MTHPSNSLVAVRQGEKAPTTDVFVLGFGPQRAPSSRERALPAVATFSMAHARIRQGKKRGSGRQVSLELVVAGTRFLREEHPAVSQKQRSKETFWAVSVPTHLLAFLRMFQFQYNFTACTMRSSNECCEAR